MKLLALVVVGMVVMLQLPREGEAACCGSTQAQKCGDCTNPSPHCGKGRCNIFGCNCEGGCRNGSCGRRRRDLGPSDVISRADVDGDGRMSMEEAHALLADMEFPADRVKRELKDMDQDNDDYLSPGEIDQEFF